MSVVTRPDIVLLGGEWPERALLRAQLIEDGYEVVALDVGPIPEMYRQPGMKPRMIVVDLRGLPEPRETLDTARGLLPRDQILVVTALGTLTADDVRRLGLTAIERPTTIGRIVETAAGILAASPKGAPARPVLAP
jgi:hypothetical protein